MILALIKHVSLLKIILMERKSSVEALMGSANEIQPVFASGSALLTLNSQLPNISLQCVSYLHRIISLGLIDVLERLHFSGPNRYSFSLTAIRIFNVLVAYLKSQYEQFTTSTITSMSQAAPQQPQSLSSQLTSLSKMAASVINPAKPTVAESSQLIQLPKYFNYYASIRREIFEFLLRIRSDRFGQLLLLNRQNSRRIHESKNLHLTIRFVFNLICISHVKLEFK